MKKDTFRLFALIFCVGLLTACGSGSDEAAQEVDNSAEASNDTTFTIDWNSKQLAITLSKDLIYSAEPELIHNESFGQFEIRAGDRFQINISEDDIPMSEFKEDLTNDLLLTCEFDSETPEELIYKTVLPDGNPLSYHFIKKMAVDDMNLIVRSEPMGEFSKMNMQKMQDAVNSIRKQ